jgi:hypothetical protein
MADDHGQDKWYGNCETKYISVQAENLLSLYAPGSLESAARHLPPTD